MNEEYGSDFITVTDEEGNEFELEHLDTIEINDQTYMAFLPADMDENDEDYGMILMKVTEEDGEEVLITLDNEDEAEMAYNKFMEQLFDGEEDEA